MYILYLIALVPVFIGLMLFLFTKRVAWVEWVCGTVLSFIVAGCFHSYALYSMTADVETWSGELNVTVHYPEWVEKYHVTHHTYDKKGRITGTYTTTHYRTHHEYWDTSSNIDTSYNIEKSFHDNIVVKFGGQIDVSQPHKSGFYSGDRNIYTTHNKTGYVFPITKVVSFENRVKASPTLFSFAKVPENIDKKLYAYPENNDHFASNRLIGIAANCIDLNQFDVMNAKLGPKKLVNVIMVGFADTDAQLGEWQRAKWIGGKKNDLVICYGAKTNPKKAEWCRVFGWTENETVKRKIETLVVNNGVDNKLLDGISTEISEHYKLKDWTKFDYITIEPSEGIIICMTIIMILMQIGFYIFALLNEINNFKDLKDLIDEKTGSNYGQQFRIRSSRY